MYKYINNFFYNYFNHKTFVILPYNSIVKQLIYFWYSKGLISKIILIQINKKYVYKIFFIYLFHSIPLYKHFKILSKPSKRVYISYTNINKFLLSSNSNLTMVLTTHGILTLIDCLRLKIGGELVCIIY